MYGIAKTFSTVLPGLLLVLPSVTLAAERLDLPKGEDWKHPHVDVTIPATVGGIERSSATVFADDFLDIAHQYDSPDGSEALSIYVFRDTNGGVPVWFEQARWGIENRPMFAEPELFVAPSAVVPPGGKEASALKAVYATGDESQFRSTGVILASLDGWYVKIRASSKTRTPASMSNWMDFSLAQVSMPRAADLPAATVVENCETPLSFGKKAKDAPNDGAANLLGGLLGMIAGQMPDDEDATEANSETVSEPVTWCRDSVLDGSQTVYRADNATDRYLLAFGDNGNAVIVQLDQTASLLGETSNSTDDRFSITLKTANRDINFVPQNCLPSPARVIKIINENRRTTTFPTWGEDKSIEVNSDAI